MQYKWILKVKVKRLWSNKRERMFQACRLHARSEWRSALHLNWNQQIKGWGCVWTLEWKQRWTVPTPLTSTQTQIKQPKKLSRLHRAPLTIATLSRIWVVMNRFGVHHSNHNGNSKLMVMFANHFSNMLSMKICQLVYQKNVKEMTFISMNKSCPNATI